MNQNQVKGALKDVAGKVQEEVGKLVGSKEQQAKGLVVNKYQEKPRKLTAMQRKQSRRAYKNNFSALL